MEKLRVCKTCKKELGEFEGCQIPVYMPATMSFPLPSGGVELYCEKCYKDAVGETFLDESKKRESKNSEENNKIKNYKQNYRIISIKDVSIGQNVHIIGKICSEIHGREIHKPDKVLKLYECMIKDDTDEIKLILWNDQANNIHSGDFYSVEGYIQEFNGKKQITLGYRGRIEKISFEIK